jgi:hypothetical protein
VPLAPWAADLGVHDLKDELQRLWASWSHGARAIGGAAAMGAGSRRRAVMGLAHGGAGGRCEW